MKKCFYIFVLLLSLCLQANAEYVINPVAEEQLPDMPSISRLKEVSMPTASLANGAVEFEVPLYTLTAEDFSLPLTLRYRSNGIKPDDDPYPLGLGWSLSPGLRITRSIRGRADGDYPFFNGNMTQPTYEQLLSSVAGYSRYQEQNIQHDINRIDSEHDIFYVFLPEVTLVLMNIEGNFIGVNCNEYKITSKSDLNEIEIVSPRGLIYRFLRDGQIITIDNRKHNLEWLLYEIELTSGNKVEFSWELTNHMLNPLPLYTNRMSYGYWSSDKSVESDGQSLSRTHTSLLHKDIANIRYLDFNIKFEYGDSNISYGSTLKKLNIFWNTEKKYSIIFGYNDLPSGHLGQPVLLNHIDHYADGRYSFTYYPDNSSGGFDRWGFSNGVENTIYHLPEIDFKSALTNSRNFRMNGRSFEISETHMKSNLLQSVQYPTGGKVVWNYEVHEFEPIEEREDFSYLIGTDRLEKGGGLRISSISLYQSATDDNPRIRRYSYSKGKCVTAPLRSTFLNTYAHESAYTYSDNLYRYAYLLRRNIVEIKNVSDYLEYQDGIFPIWYEEVTEYDTFGKTEYKFKSFIPENKITRKFGRVLPDSIYSIFSSGPQLVEKTTYRSFNPEKGNRDSIIINKAEALTYLKTRHETYDYEITSLAPVENLAVKRKLTQTQMKDYSPDFCLRDTFYMDLGKMNLPIRQPTFYMSRIPYDDGLPPIPYLTEKNLVYDHSTYAVVPMQERPKSKRTVDYTKGELATLEEYSYIPGTGIIDRITTSRDSDFSTLSLRYIPDGEIGRTMRERNMVGVVTSSTTSFDGCTSTAEFTMSSWNGKIIKPKTLTLSRGSTSHTVQNYRYDSHGNIREIRRPDGFCSSYLWGYDGLYPVYKFSRMSFDALLQKFGSQIESTDAQSLNLDLSLAECPTEYAEYLPLVGICTYKDAAGVTTKYRYDSAGRLNEVSIDGHGTVATYDYNIGGGRPNFVAENIQVDNRGSSKNRSVETFDGLGRSISRVNSYPQGLLANYTVYDAMGRPVKAWLPTPVDSEHPSLSDIESAATEAYSDSNPYSVSNYEASSEGRLLSTIRPGQDWHSIGKKISYDRRVNNTTLFHAPRYKVTASGIEYLGNYRDINLLMEETKDEDGITVQTYTDFRGLKIAEKQGMSGSMLCTRYVYDGYGDLRYVLPPKLADGTYDRNDTEMQELAYWYDYDARGNVILKKLPGREAIHYRYDSSGRLVAVQDGNTAPHWQLSFYDRLGRIAVEAEADWSESQLASFLEAICTVNWTGNGVLGGYTPDRTLPKDVKEIHITRRYDSAGRISIENAGKTVRTFHYNKLGQTDSMTVDYGKAKLLYSYNYNYRGNKTIETVRSSGITLPTLCTRYGFDTAGRNIGITAVLNDIIPILSANNPITDTIAATRIEYDRLGRPARRRFGIRGNTYYEYDIHGDIAAQKSTVLMQRIPFKPDIPIVPFRSGHISDFDSIVIDLPDPFEPGPIAYGGTRVFADTLLRNNGLTPLYNGRIASRKTVDGRYDYTYDSYSRLTAAAFSGKDDADYSTEYSYDDNANLTTMIRNGVIDRAGTGKIYSVLDALGVSLEGNRAVQYDIESGGDVFEGRTGFGSANGSFDLEYDSNGNVVFDGSIPCAYEYNRFDKPVSVENDAGLMTFEYDGAGTLISRTAESGGVITTTEFFGPYELVDGDMRAAYFDGGYFDTEGIAHYYIPDYQGNIIADVTAGGEIKQTAAYYPYGEPWLEPDGDNRRLFSGKERLNFGTFRHSDFGPRLLDTRASRWNSQDSHQESYLSLSPYSVCSGDPINYVDKNGKDITLLTADMHIAMLIGNDNNGWRYFSMNGVQTFQKTDGLIGGSNKHNLGEEIFPSVEDFMKSNFNTSGTKEEVKGGVTSGYNYTKAYTVSSTFEQDLKAISAFVNTTNNEYQLFSNNCANAVSNSLRAAGFEFSNISNNAYYIAYRLADNIQQNNKFTLTGLFMKYIIHEIDRFPIAIPTLIFNNFKQRYPDGKTYQ